MKPRRKKAPTAFCVACLAAGALREGVHLCAAPLASGVPCGKGTCHEHARPIHPVSERGFACRDHDEAAA
jgi:hypothetical protein